MNRCKINKLIVIALTASIISNSAIPIRARATEVKNVNLVINNNSDTSNEKVLINEDFSTKQIENSDEFKQWWENETRPIGWQLRKWKGADATGDNVPFGKVIEDEDFNGGSYVDIEFNKSVGFFQPDDFTPISDNEDYNIFIKLKKKDISSAEPVTIRAEFYDEKKTVIERQDIFKLSGSGDWEIINKSIKSTKLDAKYMKIIFIFGNVSASSVGAKGGLSIDSLRITCNKVNIEKVDFLKDEVFIGINRSYKPNIIIYPKEATEGFILESENDDIAKIKDGSIYGVAVGETNIICKSDSGKVVGSIKVNVEELNTESYDKALDSIFEAMVPNSIIDINDIQIMKIVNEIESTAKKHWNSMNKSNNKNGLWEDTQSTTNSAHVTTQFNRLYDMSLAYVMEGSGLKDNKDLLEDITSGLQWLKANRYDGKKFYNNWWDWEIGSPQKLNGILILLRDKFSYNELVEYTNIVDNYVKDPTLHTQGKYPAVGGNRADMCKVVIYSGLLSGNEDRIALGVKDMNILFEYVDDIIEDGRAKTDGYYKDGSWVEHGNIPYAGTYGSILMGGVGEIVHVLSDTPWSISKDKIDVMYDVILKSFEPLIYKGSMMNMVSGRAISRDNELDYGHGFGVMRRILAFYTENAPEEYKTRFKSMIKQWIVSNDTRDILANSNNLQFTVQAKNLMGDDSIKVRGELLGNYIFANMDRAVHRRPGYVFGVSMYSSRIANYESLNGENLKGYHSSDGMTYLYNGDIEQYAKDFWPTVDAKRLAGTTVDTKNIFEKVAGQNYGPGESATSNKDWVGGASLGDFGVVGMHLDNKRSDPKKDLGMDLEAKKSYFMFDDEIVALGAGINSTKDNGIETTVENRIINNNDKIYINEEEITNKVSNGEKTLNVKSVYLESDTEDKSIGYYFPNATDIKVKKETREGAWKDINNGKSDVKKTNTFFTLWNDHGVKPKNGSYEYVIVPNASKEKVASYSNSADIKIIDNNESVQAVKENRQGIIAANFWDKEGGKLSDGYISSSTQASIILKNINGKIELAVSDPTMKNTGNIVLTIDESLGEVIENDAKAKVENKDGKTVITVNASKAVGASMKISFKANEKIASWNSNVKYEKGDLVTFKGKTYECLQEHSSIVTWEPNVAHSLWKEKVDSLGGINWSEGINYKKGDIVMYKEKIYECIQGHSSLLTWTPDITASLWKLKDK